MYDRMTVRITYFVHGTTTENEQNRATGWLSGELSVVGKQQATELGRLVADKKFDVVFCSDLTRAVDSVERAFGHRCPIIQDPVCTNAITATLTEQRLRLKTTYLSISNTPFLHESGHSEAQNGVDIVPVLFMA